ncbi:WD40 repeat-like protein [Leucogyrophana mollusca]|uniref:WD40 repeat-like protein n=1 Tax=Leucogyrophana mollusca TaxID=85980 RepID=A0ACB8C1S4_9AGAM|nr:WD40 repeat-like protein [Leucogyrophana mollusca]
MRTQHTSHPFPAFPVFSCAFLAPDQLVVGGGGGASRSGIKNRLRLYHVSDERQLKMVDELELEKDEDAPMSMAADPENRTFICGINSTETKLKQGGNENCRMFSVTGDSMSQVNTRGTLFSGNPDDYQRVTVLSPDGKFLAVAGENDFTLLAYPSLVPVAQPIHFAKGEIYDATFSSSHVVVATSSNLLLYALPQTDSEKPSKGKKKSKQKGKEKETPLPIANATPELQLVKTLTVPTLPGSPAGSTTTFRAARFHPSDHSFLYAALNTTAPRAPKAKSAKRQAYIVKWNVAVNPTGKDGWDAQVERLRKAGESWVTCLDASPNGKFLAFGLSDYSLCLVDTVTLAPLLSILKAHEFPVTTIRFNPTSRLLVSGSADCSLRVVGVPEQFGGQSWTMIMLIILALLAVALAIVMRK